MKETHQTRRSFLKKLAAGAALTAASISAGTSPSRADSGSSMADSKRGEITYRETRAFSDYYRSLRD